jgi:hypothetical protein
MKGNIALFGLALLTILGGLWPGDMVVDRTYKLSVVGDAPVYAQPPQQYPESNPKVATLTAGQPVKVTRMAYGKDFQTFHIEAEAGISGWVVAGEGIKVTVP